MYFAWRLIEAHPELGPRICIFDQADQVGGRIMTLRNQGPRGDLTVEAGAYRYVDKPIVATDPKGRTWKTVWTPLTAALLEKGLQLPTAPYEPGDPVHAMRKIVDRSGHNAGYVTFVEELLKQVKSKGLRFFPGQTLTSIAAGALHPGEGFALAFSASDGSDPEVVFSEKVLLNIPQQPLLQVLRVSPFLWASDSNWLDGTTPMDPLYVPTRSVDVKLYVYYEDAWWINDLNLTTGMFEDDADTNAQHAPLAGRYHDGDVRCDPRCRGFLEAVYTNEARREAAIKFYENYQLYTGSPYSILDDSTMDGRALLEKVHASLLRLHRSQLVAAGALERVEALHPSQIVLSVWDSKVKYFGAATHHMKNGTIPPRLVSVMSLKPFSGKQIYLANEAFGPVSGWAEGSLVMAENIVHQLGLDRPSWLSEDVYEKHVLFPPSGESALSHHQHVVV